MAYEYGSEAEVCRDAVEINEGGACNPVAISGRLHEAIRFYGNGGGWDNCKSKPALRLMLHQLGFLLGEGDLYLDHPFQSWRKDITECNKISEKKEG